MARNRIFSSLVLLLFSAGAVYPAGELELYQLQKVIMELQARAVRGDARSSVRAKELISRVAEQFEKFGKDQLSSKRNTVAAISYLLSGGRSVPVRRALAIGKFSESYRAVLEGALAYSEGQENVAREKLDPVDPLSVDPVLSGPLAFARGTLAMSSDYDTSLRMYDVVRLVAPKSAFDEAAMRRRAIIFSDKQEMDKFMDLSIAYFRYFPKSPYAESFRVEATSILIASIGKQKYVAPQKLIMFLSSQDSVARERKLTEMIKEAVLSGNTGLALDLTGLTRKSYPKISQKSALMEFEQIAGIVSSFATSKLNNKESKPVYSDSEALLWSNIRQAIAKMPIASNSTNAQVNPAGSIEDWRHASAEVQAVSSATRVLLGNVRKDLEGKN